jgi:hypothetical protein
MKIFLVIIAITCAAAGARAQTNTPRYVPNGADMRIVDGKMYNRVLSTNWTTLPEAGAALEVVEVNADGVVAQSRKDDVPGGKLLLRHYPSETKLTKGETLKTSFRAMQVASVKYADETVPAYDCGLPNTAENRKTLKNGQIKAVQ